MVHLATVTDATQTLVDACRIAYIADYKGLGGPVRVKACLIRARWLQVAYAIAAVLLVMEPTPVRSQPGVFGAMLERSLQLFNAGRYAEAERLANQARQMAQARFGTVHRAVGRGYFELARIHARQGDYDRALSEARQSLAIFERVFGNNSGQVASALILVGSVISRQGKFDEAEALLRRSDRMLSTVRLINPQQRGQVKQWLGINAFLAGRSGDAEIHLREALRRQAAPSLRVFAARSHLWLGRTLARGGKDKEAELHYLAAIKDLDTAVGAEVADLAAAQERLAHLYSTQGRIAESESMLQRAVATHTRVFGQNNTNTAWSKSILAAVLNSVDRNEEAEPWARAAVVSAETARSLESRSGLLALTTLGRILAAQGKIDEADAVLHRSRALEEKLGRSGYHSSGEAEAELALVHLARGEFDKAEAALQVAMTATQDLYGADHPDLAVSHWRLSEVLSRAGRLTEAREAARRAGNILVDRMNDKAEPLASRGAAGTPAGHVRTFAQIVRLAWQAAAHGEDPRQALEEALIAAEHATASAAGSAVQQMSSRLADGGGPLAELLRETQNLTRERSELERQFGLALGAPSETSGSQAVRARADVRADVRRDIEAISARIKGLEQRLAAAFPNFASLIRSGPLSLAELQGLLAEDEAMVVTHVSQEATYVWAVTRQHARWNRTELGHKELAKKVEILRCGLEAGAWIDEARRARCRSLGLELTSTSLPFDLATSYELYRELLTPIAAVIAGKTLIVVPGGPLTSLPFQVMTTAPPKENEPANYADAKWLSLHHAMAVLPSVSSLRALRAGAFKPASLPFIGYGAPVFSDGIATSPASPRGGKAAAKGSRNPALVAERTIAEPQATAVARTGTELPSRAVARVLPKSVSSYYRNARPDLEQLRKGLAPLPETQTELRDVAASVHAALDTVRTGHLATETAVKQTPLDDYRIVYFATHGLVAGEVEGLGEPALALTLPRQASDIDDGLLMSSEVAQLKLNADWVVLSACNTASGSGPGAEALSGLASAFLYAGARSLLVTHWQVWSDAAVTITTGTFSALAAQSGMRRSEALRQSMETLIATKDAEKSHPAYWAPFVVVGDGR